MSEQKEVQDTQVEDTIALVQDAQKQGTFNLSEVIKGRGFPQKTVTVYTDAEAAFRLVELNKKMSDTKDKDALEKLEVESQKLAEVVKSSRLDFHMQGVPQAVIETVESKADKLYPSDDEQSRSDEWFKAYIAELVALNIVSVTDASGNTDQKTFTYEDAVELRSYLPTESWTILVSTMQKLTLASGFFNGLTDAGFLPRS
jgi:hypothetical protein